jgi:hypothetical protein
LTDLLNLIRIGALLDFFEVILPTCQLFGLFFIGCHSVYCILDFLVEIFNAIKLGHLKNILKDLKCMKLTQWWVLCCR